MSSPFINRGKYKGELDYFQKAKMFDKDIWIIDDGVIITWLLPEKYGLVCPKTEFNIKNDV